MPQYDYSLVARCYQTFLDAIGEYPDHSDGAPRWEQRTYHPGRDGSVQPLERALESHSRVSSRQFSTLPVSRKPLTC